MFINVSNHHHAKWSDKQMNAAIELGGGEIVTLQHPVIDPYNDEDYVAIKANEIIEAIARVTGGETIKCLYVHAMGELTFITELCDLLRYYKNNDHPELSGIEKIKFVVSTTDRVNVELPNGTKISEFKFIQFRELKAFGDDPKRFMVGLEQE